MRRVLGRGNGSNRSGSSSSRFFARGLGAALQFNNRHFDPFAGSDFTRESLTPRTHIFSRDGTGASSSGMWGAAAADVTNRGDGERGDRDGDVSPSEDDRPGAI